MGRLRTLHSGIVWDLRFNPWHSNSSSSNNYNNKTNNKQNKQSKTFFNNNNETKNTQTKNQKTFSMFLVKTQTKLLRDKWKWPSQHSFLFLLMRRWFTPMIWRYFYRPKKARSNADAEREQHCNTDTDQGNTGTVMGGPGHLESGGLLCRT